MVRLKEKPNKDKGKKKSKPIGYKKDKQAKLGIYYLDVKSSIEKSGREERHTWPKKGSVNTKDRLEKVQLHRWELRAW